MDVHCNLFKRMWMCNVNCSTSKWTLLYALFYTAARAKTAQIVCICAVICLRACECEHCRLFKLCAIKWTVPCAKGCNFMQMLTTAGQYFLILKPFSLPWIFFIAWAFQHCVTRAPLLYFLRSWVALSLLCESVSQWVSEASVTPVQISTFCNI